MQTAIDEAPSAGVMSDSSGELIVKPCTPAEVVFYEIAISAHPDLAFFMPRFMGTLQFNNAIPAGLITDGVGAGPQIAGLEALHLATATHAPSSSVPGTVASKSVHETGVLKGKKLETDLHIVLENVISGFKQPNVMDIKLGARLWDEDAKPDKRARLDQVAAETTSSSLGFRIAGMRVWQGEKQVGVVQTLADVISDKAEQQKTLFHLEEGNYRHHNKFYGRHFDAENVIDAFREYLLVSEAGIGKKHALIVARKFLIDLLEMQSVLEAEESRMYSASILLVYEGDPAALEMAVEAEANPPPGREEPEDDADLEEDEDEEEIPKFFAVKIIDFAHASFQTGIGPDENMLEGVRSVIKILKDFFKELKV